MKYNKFYSKRGASFIGMLIMLIIICALVYITLNGLTKGNSSDPSSSVNVLDNAKQAVEKINNKQSERIKEMNGF